MHEETLDDSEGAVFGPIGVGHCELILSGRQVIILDPRMELGETQSQSAPGPHPRGNRTVIRLGASQGRRVLNPFDLRSSSRGPGGGCG